MSKLLECVELETAPNPEASILWMHGLGADGYDFHPIVEELDLPPLPVRFVFPHAPARPVTINGGYVMRAWYDIMGEEFGGREDEEGLRTSEKLVLNLIAREEERGIAAERIVLAGFSQGGAISLQTGLRHSKRLAGILVLSAYLPIRNTLKAEASEANRDVPIFMAHGTLDQTVPIEYARRSSELLSEMGYPVEWHEYAMPHSVSPEEIDDIGRWFKRVLTEVTSDP
jgi:phospholipase/carboxylesterase